jgi:hypothetical protein
MNLLHRREGLHPCDIAEIEHNAENLKRLTRKDALTEARWYFRDRGESATPEEILSVAAKLEAYLTAPETVLSDSLNTRQAR